MGIVETLQVTLANGWDCFTCLAAVR